MNMCEAFSQLPEVNVTLLVNRNNDFKLEPNTDIWNFYNVKSTFEIIFLPQLSRIIGKITLLKKLFTLFNLASALFKEFRNRREPFIVFSRHHKVVKLMKVIQGIAKNRAYRGYFCELHDLFTGPVYLKSYAGLIVISSALKKDLIDKGIKVPENRILVAQDGVAIHRYENFPEKDSIYSEYGLPRGKKIIAYTGRLAKGKGVDILIQAFAGLKNRKDLLLLLVGQIFDDEYREIAVAHGLENIIFTGFVPPSRVRAFQLIADILVLPSNRELPYFKYTSPIKLFEYMAAGKPIAASALDSISEIIRHKENGILFNPSDPQSLADSILYLLDHKDFSAKIAARAKADVLDYTWLKRAENIHRFIQQHINEDTKD
ncbi:MAG: glycosyltransferase [Candidatus Aminicenantes bacterium]|nr:glycosyltransferase [Candidatus Aminicenantes bacterium]NIM84217.1 glycosyltransferase [Candidatus Aminicenantes bacterium]NIN47373.1 glycosyltransferase [Candidatus Aminicenantes bacterium]NIN90301.1 glycosyltransferase [Candidatus Aminicenantes bacterium]NIO86964.1 glycosyltransferase [Candidatus Aminicenantes bacterium]